MLEGRFLAWVQDGRRWGALMGAALLLGGSWIWARAVPAAATSGGLIPSPREGFAAPDFTLELLDGGTVTLSELRGKVVLINLWASWCPPCRAEMPAIEAVYQANKDQGLEVLAVNTTYQDSLPDAVAFIQQYGLTFPVPLDRTGEVARQYQLRALPSTFFVDRKGVIRKVIVGGPMSEATIESTVQGLLQEAP